LRTFSETESWGNLAVPSALCRVSSSGRSPQSKTGERRTVRRRDDEEIPASSVTSNDCEVSSVAAISSSDSTLGLFCGDGTIRRRDDEATPAPSVCSNGCGVSFVTARPSSLSLLSTRERFLSFFSALLGMISRKNCRNVRKRREKQSETNRMHAFSYPGHGTSCNVTAFVSIAEASPFKESNGLCEHSVSDRRFSTTRLTARHSIYDLFTIFTRRMPRG
jgi:hypothetical protein